MVRSKTDQYAADEIDAVEAGRREPTVPLLKAVASVLRIGLDDLV